jgi:hypothetical protein
MEIDLALPSNAPEEVRQFVSKLKNLTIPTPATDELASIVAAGPGEHQDRLFTLAVKKQLSKAVRDLMDQMEAIHTANCQKCSHGSN